MTTYANRIKRKRFFEKISNSFVRFITATTSETEETQPLYRLIWNDIKEGLDYGIDIRYNLFDADDFMPSLEVEFGNYFNKDATENELNIVFQALTEKLLPNYISKYKDLELNTGEDEKGKFFVIEFVK